MADAEQNPEETQTPPSALEVLDRIEAEKAEAAGVEKPAEAKEATVEVVNIVNVADASEAKGPEAEPEVDTRNEREKAADRVKVANVRLDAIKEEIAVHEKAVKELNTERSKVMRDVKHDRELTRPPLHELNKEQARITAEERAQRQADADTLRRLGAMRKQPRTYPPKFKTS